ncbi:MAG: hypothetical protein JSR33_07770 [Proteobacteria bacterium]|nr:hypothetical protein [Pseudomonadota bacterium]
MNDPNFIIPAYRGQSNSDCPPIPSLYRPGTNREFELRNSKDLIYSDEWFFNAIEWSKKWVESGKILPDKKSDIDEFLVNIFKQIGYPNLYKKYNDRALISPPD